MILVSRCLLGECCRYDGGHNLDPRVRALFLAGKAVAVCPEVLGGLPVPREPSELRDGRVVSVTGRDVTDAFELGARRAMDVCLEHRCDLAILKAKSPSCGKGTVHNGLFDGGLTEGDGVFARLLLDSGIPVLTEKDDLSSVL